MTTRRVPFEAHTHLRRARGHHALLAIDRQCLQSFSAVARNSVYCVTV